MKRSLAILLAVVLFITTVFSTAMFSVAADGEETETLTDTVVMPKYVDSLGDEVYLYHTAKNLPESVMTHNAVLTVNATKNSSKLPFTALFEVSGGNEKTAGMSIKTKPVNVGENAGFMFYVEAPVNRVPYNYTYLKDGVETVATTTDFHLAFSLPVYDYDKDKVTTFNQYGWVTAYTLAVGDNSWKSQTIMGYGVNLASGFKGYVYVPFKSYTSFAAEDYIEGININDITANSNYNHGSSVDYLLKSYIANGESLRVSAPIIVKGEYGSSAAPDASSVVIDGEKYYYNAGKPVDLSSLSFPSVSTGVIKTNMSTTSNVTTKFELNADYGKRSDYYGLSALTDEVGTSTINRIQYSIGDYDNSARLNAAYTFPETIKLNGGGFIFYAELPELEGNHEICFKRTYADGTVNMTQATGVTWYRLEDGTDEWVSGVTGTNAYGINFGDYNAEIGKAPAWSGYIYFPYNFFRMLSTNDQLVEFGIGMKVYRTTDGNDSYPGTPLAAAARFSAVTHVTEFDANTTLAYGDGGRLVDLATGKYIYSEDYSAADSMIGNSALVKAGNPKNVLQMEYINDVKMNSTIIDFGNGGVYTDINKDGIPNGKLVESGAVIKHPAIELSKSVEAGHSGRLVYINTPTIYTIDGDGLAFYVKNYSDSPVNLRFGSYGAAYKPNEETGEPEKVNGGYLDYYGVYYKLLGNDGKWQSLKGDARKMPVPANFEGYFYVDFSSMPNIGAYADNEGTNIYTGFAVMCDDVVLTDDNLTISYPMLVTNFTEKNAGIAFVNNAEVSQNLFTGDFAVQNDSESDLNVGLLELVRAKGTVDFETFRNDYLKYYYINEKIVEPCIRHEAYYNKKCTKCGVDIDVTGSLGNVMIMGDSISTYHGYTYGQYGVLGQAWYGKEQDNTDLTGVHQTWWDILISNMDATLAYNRSCSGSTIAEATWSNGTETKRYNSFNARLDEVLSHEELQMFGYTTEDIDTFIFFGGTNDNNAANMGEAKYSDWTAEDLKYFAPAYCRYISTVKANFPNAKIVSLVDTTLTQVAETQIAINEYYGITTVTINGFDEVAPHPTVKGMRQIEETLRYALSE